MTRPFVIGLAAALLAVVLWGIQLPIAKDAFVSVDPFFLTTVRYLVAGLCLALTLVALEGPAALRYDGRWWRASGLGAIGMCASPMLVFLGMSMSRACISDHGCRTLAVPGAAARAGHARVPGDGLLRRGAGGHQGQSDGRGFPA